MSDTERIPLAVKGVEVRRVEWLSVAYTLVGGGLALAFLGVFDAVVESRTAVDETYERYFAERQAIETKFS